MNYTLRFSGSMVGAAGLTIALFYLMVSLISQNFEIPEQVPGLTVTIVDPVEMEELTIKEPKKVKPIPPEALPPTPETTKLVVAVGPGTGIKIDPPVKDGTDVIDFGLADGGMLPLVSVQPNYPRRAAQRGIEGYTIVEFEVSAQGLVKNPRVIEHEPNSVFDAESLKAIRKFKYKPEVIEGQAVPRTGVLNKFTFELKQG